MSSAKEASINPHYPVNVTLNQQATQKIRNIASLAMGTGAGILRLESYYGFLFYLIGSLILGGAIYLFTAHGKPADYYVSPLKNVWLDDVVNGLASFILTWTLFYGLVSA